MHILKWQVYDKGLTWRLYMKTKLLLIMTLTMIFQLILGGCRGAGEEKEERKVAVEVATVKKGSIAQEITIASKLQPFNNIMIIPKTPGLEITKLAVDVGDTVKEGDFLFELDKDIVRRQVEVTRKSYEQAQNNYRIQKQQMEKMADYTTSIPASMITGGVTQQFPQVDRSQTSVITAEAQLEQARLAYVSALEQLDEMEYYAPINGVITQNNLVENQIVVNTQPALIITNIDQLKMELYVTKSLYNTFHLGKEILFSTGGKEKQGKVSAINDVADPRTNLYYVQILVDNKEKQLLAGSLCKLKIEREKNESTLIIPKKAVFYEGDIATVYTENQEKAIKRHIELGIDGGEIIEVTQGLQERERIITKGQHYIDENTPLIVVRGDDNGDT